MSGIVCHIWRWCNILTLFFLSIFSIAIFKVANFREVEFYRARGNGTTKTDDSVSVCAILRWKTIGQRITVAKRWTGGLERTAATDYPYSLSGKTREREVNVPLINSVKLSDRRMKRSAQVGAWRELKFSRIFLALRAMFHCEIFRFYLRWMCHASAT